MITDIQIETAMKKMAVEEANAVMASIRAPVEFKPRAPKPLKCVCCGKTFLVKSDLRDHLLTHTKIRPYGCSLCDYVSNKKVWLKKHLKVNHQKNESEDDFMVVNEKKLEEMEDVINSQVNHALDSMESGVPIIPTYRTETTVVERLEPKLLQCLHCDLKCPKKQMRRHLPTHYDYKPYKCRLCKMVTGSRASILIHIKSVHQLKNWKEDDFITDQELMKEVKEAVDKDVIQIEERETKSSSIPEVSPE